MKNPTVFKMTHRKPSNKRCCHGPIGCFVTWETETWWFQITWFPIFSGRLSICVLSEPLHENTAMAVNSACKHIRNNIYLAEYFLLATKIKYICVIYIFKCSRFTCKWDSKNFCRNPLFASLLAEIPCFLGFCVDPFFISLPPGAVSPLSQRTHLALILVSCT